MMMLCPTKKKKEKNKSKRSWTLPQVIEGGGVQVGGLGRPGMYQPNPLRRKATISKPMHTGVADTTMEIK